MRSRLAMALSVTLSCLLLATPAVAQAKFDGSKPMLCAISAVSECTADGKCERSVPTPESNLVKFVRVDVQGKLLTDNDGSGRKSEIKASTVADGHLVLQGVENGKAWTLAIHAEGGGFGASVVENDGLFAIFGNCTLP